ncbi:hypothetical protein [Flexibacterium corallicola]|nr:hypothetical protein [Pseudovibrio sp. M1P-2-3]
MSELHKKYLRVHKLTSVRKLKQPVCWGCWHRIAPADFDRLQEQKA